MHSSNPDSIDNHIGMIFFALVLAVLFISNSWISEAKFPLESESIPVTNLEEFINVINDDTKDTYPSNNPNHKIMDQEDFRENVVIFSLTTTWCPHCPSVLIALEQLRKTLQEQGITNVKILSFNVGDENLKELRVHAKKNGLRDIFDKLFYKSVSKNVMEKLSLQGVPVCIMFGMEGEFLGCHVGGVNYASDDFVKYIKQVSGHAEITESDENLENEPIIKRG